MRFKQFLQEEGITSIQDGQAEIAHEPSGEESVSVNNPRLRVEVNKRLSIGLNDVFYSPEDGIQAIRKVLHRYGFDLPALYDADSEGDEVVIAIDQYGDLLGDDPFANQNYTNYNSNPNDDDADGEMDTDYSVYILYYMTDEGHYEFYAEVGDDDRMDELLSDEGEPEEEV